MNPAVSRIMAEGNLGHGFPHVVPKAIPGCRSAAAAYLFACPKKIVWKCVAKLLTKVHHRDHIHHGNCSDGQLPESLATQFFPTSPNQNYLVSKLEALLKAQTTEIAQL